jgi:hypothetical protein
MSDRYRYCSSGAPSGILTGPNWACGTRRYCAWPPGTYPYSEVYPSRAAPLPLVSYLSGLALGEKPALAHPAVPAGDIKRNHHPVSGPQTGDVRADLLDDPHGLVPENVAGLEERAEHSVQMQVRAGRSQ